MKNKVVGIFPEGGSHDRTEMLPLKPGACIFVWECKKKLNQHVPIVPIGITYYGQHKFRSKVAIKIGHPIHFKFDKKKFEDSEYKKQMIKEMLITLEEKMNQQLI